MAWTSPRTWITGEVVTSTHMNTHVRDDLLQTAPAKVTTAGDIVQGTGANALARLGIGGAAAIPKVNAGASALEYLERGAAKKVLTVDNAGTNIGYKYPTRLLEKDTSDVSIVNSAVAAVLYDVTIPGGLLGSSGGIKVHMDGFYLNNHTSSHTCQFQVKLGGVAIISSSNFNMDEKAINRSWVVEIGFTQVNSAAQNWSFWAFISGEWEAGWNICSANSIDETFVAGAGVAASSVNMATDKVLEVLAMHGYAHTEVRITKYAAHTEFWEPD